MKVICGGCFNKLHEGHKYFLKEAKKLGYLIVMIASDEMNKRKHGNKAIKIDARKRGVEELKIADKILTGKKDRMEIVLKEKPDIIALGYDQEMPELSKESLKAIEEKINKKIKIVRIGKFQNGKRESW